MKFLDLIQDPGTGQLSQTKLWANIAYTAGTVAFLYPVFASGTPPDADALLIYLGVVGSHCAASKLISMRYGSGYGGGYRSSGYRGGSSLRDDLRSPAYRDDPEGP